MDEVKKITDEAVGELIKVFGTQIDNITKALGKNPITEKITDSFKTLE